MIGTFGSTARTPRIPAFTTDPGKQTVPKAWKGKNVEQLEQAVYEYTKATLLALKEKDAFPTIYNFPKWKEAPFPRRHYKIYRLNALLPKE